MTLEIGQVVKPNEYTSAFEQERHRRLLNRAIAISAQSMLYIATAEKPDWEMALGQMKVADRFISLFVNRAHKVEMVATTVERVREHKQLLAATQGQ